MKGFLFANFSHSNIIFPFIGVSRRKCLEGQNYWIVNTCSAGRACISPRRFITYNGEYSFLFVAIYMFEFISETTH